jgi:hypothetical protein
MGVSYYPRLVIGATLSPSDLMTETPDGTMLCPKGHNIVQGTGPFCSNCGIKLVPQLVRTYKPVFVEYAKKMHSQSAQEVFDEWDPKNEFSTRRLQFHKVDPVTSGEDYGSRARNNHFVLGFGLAQFECTECDLTSPIAIDPDHIGRLKKQIFDIIGDLDYVSREIRLYLCAYVSC